MEQQRVWSSLRWIATGRSFIRPTAASTTAAGWSTSDCSCHGWTALQCICYRRPERPRSSTEAATRPLSGRLKPWNRFIRMLWIHQPCNQFISDLLTIWPLISKSHAVFELFHSPPRCDKAIGTLYSETGYSIPWVTEMRYIGIYFVQSRKLKCSLDAAKQGFYRAANSIFSKIGPDWTSCAWSSHFTNYFKQMYADPDVRFRDSALTEKSAKFTWLCY